MLCFILRMMMMLGEDICDQYTCNCRGRYISLIAHHQINEIRQNGAILLYKSLLPYCTTLVY